MSSTTIDDVYDACERLDKASVKQVDDYTIFVSGTRSSDAKVKKLSAQMIVRYWSSFPDQRIAAFYALVSVLEDRDSEIRKSVIKEMTHLVKAGQLVDKIADVLSQILQQSDEPQEMVLLNTCLTQFLKSYPKDVLTAIFLNILKSDEEAIRIRLLKFIGGNFASIPSQLVDDDLQKFVDDQYRKILKDVTAPEFDLIFDNLRSMEAFKSPKGRDSLFKIVVELIGVDQSFPIDDIQRFDQILYFIEKCQPLLSSGCWSAELAEFLILKGLENLECDTPALRYRFMRILADVLVYAKFLPDKQIMIIFKYFISLVPLMPSEKTGSGADVEELDSEIKLSELEAIAIALLSLFRSHRKFFNSISESNDENSNWRKKLLYLARLLQHYITTSSSKLSTSSTDKANDGKEQTKVSDDALQMAENILKIVKEILHRNPSFNLSITPTWRKRTAKISFSRKRSHESASGKSSVASIPYKERPTTAVYVPPTGKFSSKFARGRGGRRYFRW